MRRQQRGFLAGAVVVLAAAIVAWVVVSRGATGDYVVGGPPGADNAGPPLVALIHGRLGELPRLQTVMGPVSLLWRAPFVAVATALGAGPHLGYEVGAIACLLTLVALVAWIVVREPTARQLAAAALAGVVMILGPATAGAVNAGHPEEVLTSVFTVAAVIAAQADRRTTAAVLLGLAVGTKEWALLAVPAVLVALPGSRRRAVVIAFGVALLVCAPLPLLDPTALHRADRTIGPVTGVTPFSAWWLSGPGGLAGHRLPFGIQRPEAAAGGLLAVSLLVWPASRRLRRPGPRGDASRIDAMALLALIGLVRCLADPGDIGYYLVALTIPLAVWEAGVLRRLPWVSLLAWATQALCFTAAAPFATRPAALHGATAVVGFVAAASLLAVHLTVRTFRSPAPARLPAAAAPRSLTALPE